MQEVDYSFNNNSNQISGTGYLLTSSTTEAILLDNGKIVHIGSESRIAKLQPSKTAFRRHFQQTSFHNIQLDSLNTLLKNIIVSAQISSHLPFNSIINNKISTEKNLKLEWNIGTQISEIPNPENEKIRMKEIDLSHQEKLYEIERQYFFKLSRKLKDVKQRLESDQSDYTRELLTEHLKEIEAEIATMNYDNLKVEKLREELKLIEQKSEVKQLYSGEINIITLIKSAP